jgi:hypothetical protein
MTLVSPNYELQVAKPYRLDLTVSVLRRLSTNIVDVLTPDGQYCRILDILGQPVLVRVSSMSPLGLCITTTANFFVRQRCVCRY